MTMIFFKGLGTALATPFRDDRVDYPAYRSMVRRQVKAGVDFIVALGSTSETPCLSDDEKAELLKITKEESGGLPVVAGVGSNSVSGTVHNMRLLDKYGADAYLVVVPFYNKPMQEGLYRYFKVIAEETDRQVILYNVPGRTGTNMTAGTVLRLSEVPNITAVKEASGNIDQILEIRRNAPADFSVLSGNDNQTLPLMACGADGVISVVSNIVPKEMKALTEAIRAGDMTEAIRLNDSLVKFYTACFAESNPIPVKAALSLLGLCTAEMRLPLTEATADTMNMMAEVVSNVNY